MNKHTTTAMFQLFYVQNNRSMTQATVSLLQQGGSPDIVFVCVCVGGGGLGGARLQSLLAPGSDAYVKNWLGWFLAVTVRKFSPQVG